MATIRERLEFEGGQLVKVDGMRPDYMDGYALLRLVRELAAELAPERPSPPVALSPFLPIIDFEDRSGEAA